MMSDASLKAVLVLLGCVTLYGVQADWNGSGEEIDSNDRRCTNIKPNSNCAAMVSDSLFVLNSHGFDDIFNTLRASSHNSNRTFVCQQFVFFSACFYTYRECDSSGAQKPICSEICPCISQLYRECVRPNVVNVLIRNAPSVEVEKFLNFSLIFNCSIRETYQIEGVAVSESSCLDLSFLRAIYPDTDECEVTDDGSEVPVEELFWGLGALLFIATLMVVVVVLVACVLRLQRNKRQLEKKINTKLNGYQEEQQISSIILEGESLKDTMLSAEEKCFYEERLDKALVSPDQLQVGEIIGEGTFGVVFRATLVVTLSSRQCVAVKKAKNLTSKQQLRSLLNESLLMKRFDHPNIVGLIGVCLDTPEGYPYLIIPFMPNGNLKDYLKVKRVHPTNTASLPDDMTANKLLALCLDVAHGMEYLSSRKFVHRDLAARNCMLDEEGVVKVGDFGLAKDVYAHLYYRGDKYSEIPIKWSAPETITDGLSTEMSDVWSFGVVCWEVFSLGATPYPGVSNYDIPHYIMSGKRLIRPPLCPQNMYELMGKCWNNKPEERPWSKELVTSLSEFIN